MPTTSLVTTFAVLTTLNNAGQLAPPDKAELPPGTVGTIFWDEQTCMLARVERTTLKNISVRCLRAPRRHSGRM